MPRLEYRGPEYEVAEYSYGSRRITLRAVYDTAEEALVAFGELLSANEMPPHTVANIKDALHTALLKHTTLFEAECLATNRRVSFIIRK